MQSTQLRTSEERVAQLVFYVEKSRQQVLKGSHRQQVDMLYFFGS